MKWCSTVLVLSLALIGCSFKNEMEKGQVFLQARSGAVKSSEFNRARIYDWACLTIKGLNIERSEWARIDATDPDARSVDFKIPNLLGGYYHVFSVMAVDTDNSKIDESILKSPCPVDLPEEEGWAQLGQIEVETPKKAKGSFKVEIPFYFYQPVAVLPDKPTNLQVSAGHRKVTLSWEAPEQDGGADISEYLVEYSTGGNSETLTPTEETLLVENLTNNVIYTFKVAAKNSAGQGSFSDIQNATPVADRVITFSTNLPSSVPGQEGAALTLSVSVNINPPGTPPVTPHYKWQKKESSGSSFSDVGSDQNTFLLQTLSSDDDDDQYRVIVSADGADPVSSTTATLQVSPPSSTPECLDGTGAPSDCYLEGTAPQYAQGLQVGTERKGPGGSTLILALIDPSNPNSFKIWKNKDGDQILNASGLVANGWQKKLNSTGIGFSNVDFTVSGIAGDIGGRVCPTNVFLSHDEMTATGRCMYFTKAEINESLNKECLESDPSNCTGEASFWLREWDRVSTGRGSAASFFEGNVKPCADRGMRLPTLYETQSNLPNRANLDLPTDAAPVFAGSKGVPSVVLASGVAPYTWTATAAATVSNVGKYWLWSQLINFQTQAEYFNTGYYIRCVLPNNLISEVPNPTR